MRYTATSITGIVRTRAILAPLFFTLLDIGLQRRIGATGAACAGPAVLPSTAT